MSDLALYVSRLEAMVAFLVASLFTVLAMVVLNLYAEAARLEEKKEKEQEMKEMKPITLMETDATREQCLKELRSMFAFFPATRSMLVQYDNSTYNVPGSLKFAVFEFFDGHDKTCRFKIDAAVSKTDLFDAITEKCGEWNSTKMACAEDKVLVDSAFFKPERVAFVHGRYGDKYAVVSLVRGFGGKDVAWELRRMVGESAGVVQ